MLSEFKCMQIMAFKVNKGSIIQFYILLVYVTCVRSDEKGRQMDPTVVTGESPFALSLVLLSLFWGLIFYWISIKIDEIILIRGFIFLLGMAFGTLTYYNESYRKYTKPILDMNPRYFLSSFFVAKLFRMAFIFETSMFAKTCVQFLLLATFGHLFCATVLGLFIFSTMVPVKFNYYLAILYGLVIVPTTDMELRYQLNNLPNVKHLQLLIEGECVFMEAFSLILFNVFLGLRDSFIEEWYQVALIILRHIVGGLVIGLPLGAFVKMVMIQQYENPSVLMVITLFWAYFGFHVASVFSFSGPLATIIIGIFAAFGRTSLSFATDEVLSNFIEIVYITHVFFAIFVFGIMTVERLTDHFELTDLMVIIVTYFTIRVTRLIAVFGMAPLLSRIGYGLTFQEAYVASLCTTRAVSSFLKAMILMKHTNKAVAEIGKGLYINATGLLIVSVTLNSIISPRIISTARFMDISTARMNNMDMCVRYLHKKKDQFISTLKMDKFLSDVRWPLVSEATTLRHPYRSRSGDNDDEDEIEGKLNRYTTCPDCLKDVPHKLTSREMAEITRETRLRILKANKVSYARQYESGTLHKSAFRLLYQAAEVAIDTKEAIIELDELFKMYEITETNSKAAIPYVKTFKFLFTGMREPKIPRRRYRRCCYKIMMHPAFESVIYVVIIVHAVVISYDFYAQSQPFSLTWIVVITVIFACSLIYLIEFWIKILGLSTVDICRNGFRTYFRSFWNCFDFVLLLIAIGNCIVESCAFVPGCNNEGVVPKIRLVARILILTKLLKLIKLGVHCYFDLVNYYDYMQSRRLELAYEVGKGFVIGEDSIEEMVVQTIENKAIKEDCKQRIKFNKLAITRQLGLIQKEKPWIAITVKTKQACMTVLNSLKEALQELKVSGWIDEIEFRILSDMVSSKTLYVNSIKTLQPNTPKDMFWEIPWLYGDENLTSHLFKKVTSKIFDAGEKVCVEGELSDGVFILVTGLLKLSYVPSMSVMEQLEEYGCLPVVDFMRDITYEENYEKYIVTGNSFGELCVLTGRPYDCTIYAETPAQVFILTQDVLKEAFQLFSDPILGLEARMWKVVGIRIATLVLLQTPAYQSFSLHKICYILGESFVPNIEKFKVVTISELVEDIVLVEGLVQDFNTKEYFIGPCYIPRTVQKLILPISSQFNFSTPVHVRLLFIPGRDVDQYEVMESTLDLSEVVSVNTLKCLQHAVQQKFKTKKKLKRAGRAVFTKRKTRVDDIATLKQPSTSPSHSTLTGQSSGSRSPEMSSSDTSATIPETAVYTVL